MKNLSNEQIQTRTNLVRDLSLVGWELQDAIRILNNHIRTSTDQIEALQGRYNELVQEAQSFIESVHDQQEAYACDRSDRWQEGDSGQAFREWMSAWELELEEIDVDLPEELEDVAFEAVGILQELPDRP